MLSNLRKVMQNAKDRGASAVEYGLMVAAIAAVIVLVVFGLGSVVKSTFNNTCETISGHVAAGQDAGNCNGGTGDEGGDGGGDGQ